MSITYLQSIGMSCQTRHQIEQFTNGPIARAAGIGLRTGFFDWLGTPPLRNGAFLDAGLPENEIGTVIDRKGRAFLTGPGFHAFHSFRVKQPDGSKTLDIEATFQTEREKFAYLKQKFLDTDVRQTCFVLGNTQNNLDGEVYESNETNEFRFDSHKIDVLHAALNRLFDAECRLIVVSNADRFDGDAAADARVRLVPAEDSEWKGDDTAWSAALCDHLGLTDERASKAPA